MYIEIVLVLSLEPFWRVHPAVSLMYPNESTFVVYNTVVTMSKSILKGTTLPFTLLLYKDNLINTCPRKPNCVVNEILVNLFSVSIYTRNGSGLKNQNPNNSYARSDYFFIVHATYKSNMLHGLNTM